MGVLRKRPSYHLIIIMPCSLEYLPQSGLSRNICHLGSFKMTTMRNWWKYCSNILAIKIISMHQIYIQNYFQSEIIYGEYMNVTHHGFWSIVHCLLLLTWPPEPRIQENCHRFKINISKNILRRHRKNSVWYAYKREKYTSRGRVQDQLMPVEKYW